MRVSMLRSGIVAAAAIGCSFASDAYAREWPTTAGWDIAETDTGCGMIMEYEGEGATELTFIKQASGKSGMSVTNYGWSAKEGQQYDLTYLLDDAPYTGQAKGISTSVARRGFVIGFGADFARDFAKASTLKIYLGDRLVDQLSLQGSAAAIAVVDRCVAGVQQRLAAEAREKARFAHIIPDPFAAPPAPSQPMKPRGSAQSWVTQDDYPVEALRERLQGTVGFKLAIGPDGRATGCTITSSSGHSLLDDTTCRLVTRRARFEPATGDTGDSIPGSYESRFTWRVPQ